MKRKILFVILAACLLMSCTSPLKSEKMTVTGFYFDTIIQIDVWGASQEIMDQCLELCEYYEAKFSNTIENSEISKINQANGETVTVSNETVELLKKGIEYGKLTDGKFDITISSVTDLWDFTGNKDGILPNETLIQDALIHVNYQNILIEGNEVTLSDPETKIDVGGIAKGYIADKLKEYLVSEGVEHALINLGGNSLAVGKKYDGSDFRIGIQKPFAEDGEAITVVEINDQSVVSSGNYQRYFAKDEMIYHHILDTATGYPVENNLLGVTIISEQSVDGDALSTSCYVLGLEEGAKLIEELEDVEAIFITDDYEIHYVE